MADINVTQRGSFDKTESYLHDLISSPITRVLEKYGDVGVRALSAATPQDSGETANSWYYTITRGSGYVSLRWHNNHIHKDQLIAILIQYGHGTKNGGYIEGRDYINPAMKVVFDDILNAVQKEVIK